MPSHPAPTASMLSAPTAEVSVSGAARESASEPAKLTAGGSKRAKTRRSGFCGDPGEPKCFTLRLPGGYAVGCATTSGVVVAPAGGLPWWLLVAIVGAGGLLAR